MFFKICTILSVIFIFIYFIEFSISSTLVKAENTLWVEAGQWEEVQFTASLIC